MSDLEDAVGSMMEAVLASAGDEFTYERDHNGRVISDTVVMRKSPQRPQQVVIDDEVIEIQLVDFITDPTLLPFGEPMRGDRIKGGGQTFTVQPPEGDKVFFQQADHQIRIHTKRTK